MMNLASRWLKHYFLILLAMALAACNLPYASGSSSSIPVRLSTGPLIVQAPANATLTPTPFQPLPPTPFNLPTDFPTPLPTLRPTATRIGDIPKTWADYPGPTVWPDIEIPAPLGILAHPAGQINILLLGSDQRPHDYGFRTDTILLVTLNPSAGTAHLTSFPRDLYVYIPGWTVQRINTAFQFGGFDGLALTMEYNFGVHPDYYALINFWSFTEVIDSLGGIDVHVGVALTDQRTGHGYYTVYPGVVHMNGDLALWYSRSRYSTSDFERTQRQQEVIQAIFVKLLSLNAIAKAPRFYEIYRKNVTTNLTLEAITPLLPLAAKLSDPAHIPQYFIGRDQVISWRTTSGAQVLLPIRERVLEVMRQALNSPPVN